MRAICALGNTTADWPTALDWRQAFDFKGRFLSPKLSPGGLVAC